MLTRLVLNMYLQNISSHVCRGFTNNWLFLVLPVAVADSELNDEMVGESRAVGSLIGVIGDASLLRTHACCHDCRALKRVQHAHCGRPYV